jgi:hypothetical protein
MADTFAKAFTYIGGTWMGSQNVEKVNWDGISEVITECAVIRVKNYYVQRVVLPM